MGADVRAISSRPSDQCSVQRLDVIKEYADWSRPFLGRANVLPRGVLPPAGGRRLEVHRADAGDVAALKRPLVFWVDLFKREPCAARQHGAALLGVGNRGVPRVLNTTGVSFFKLIKTTFP